LRIERIQDVITLHISDESCVSLRKEWVEQLRTLPYEEFGEFIRTSIYPALNDNERKIWNKATISNRDLQSAVQAEVG